MPCKGNEAPARPLRLGRCLSHKKGETMAEVPVDKRFRGSIRLVTLLLWRIAKSTNVEDGFRAARELKMFDAENEAFTRRCFALDAQLEAGEELAEPLTMELVDELPGVRHQAELRRPGVAQAGVLGEAASIGRGFCLRVFCHPQVGAIIPRRGFDRRAAPLFFRRFPRSCAYRRFALPSTGNGRGTFRKSL